MFACQECGRVFKSYRSAMRATHLGCPECGGTDVDLEDDVRLSHAAMISEPDTFGVLRRGELGHAINHGTTTTY